MTEPINPTVARHTGTAAFAEDFGGDRSVKARSTGRTTETPSFRFAGVLGRQNCDLLRNCDEPCPLGESR